MGHVGFHLRPLAERLFGLVRAADRIFGDETTLPVLAPGQGRTRTGYSWTYLRDDRPWGGDGPPIDVYHFEDSRSQTCGTRAARRPGDACLLLGASTPGVLQTPYRGCLAAGDLDDPAHGGPVGGRRADQRLRSASPRRCPSPDLNPHRGRPPEKIVSQSGPHLGKFQTRRGDPIWADAHDAVPTLSGWRSYRTRQQ
jgi:hypothetical protein